MDMTPATTQGRPGRSAQQDEEMLDDDDEPPAKTTRRTAGRATKATTAKAPAKKAPAKKPTTRGHSRKAVQSEDEEEDVVMESDEEEPAPPPKPAGRTTRRGQTQAQAATKAAPKRPARGAAAKTKQTKLDFASQRGATQDRALEISDDEVSDGEDAFEPAPIATRTRRR